MDRDTRQIALLLTVLAFAFGSLVFVVAHASKCGQGTVFEPNATPVPPPDASTIAPPGSDPGPRSEHAAEK